MASSVMWKRGRRRSRAPREKAHPRDRAVTLAWILFLAVGAPLGFMAALGPLAAAGIYLTFLSPLWQPWPPDLVKSFFGVAMFVLTLGYLAYRRGAVAGYRSGTLAAAAVFRNVVEDKGPDGGVEGLQKL